MQSPCRCAALVCGAASLLLALAIAGPLSAQGTKSPESAKPDPADRLLAMQDYMRSTADLKFHTSITDSGSGSKQISADFATRRPNLFRVSVAVPKGRYNLISDGTTLTIERPATRRYVQYRAGDSLLSTMYSAAGLMNITGRMLDFMWTANYGKAGKDVTITSLPAIMRNGRRCDGVKVIRFEEVHEVWIADGASPLPCKLISRRTDGSATSVQTHLFTWTAATRPPEGTFKFTPAAGSRKVDALDLQ